jgi:hypothetical protein
MARTSKKTAKNIAAPSGTRPGGHSQEAVAWRAYEIYMARGGEHGNDLDDWLQAERELIEKQPR